jgi:hypothetical protein
MRVFVDTYPLAIVVEEGLELDNVWMANDAHNLQFTVLWQVSSWWRHSGSHAQTDLEAFVLQDALDGGIFSARGELGLEDYTKGTVAHNLALCVRQILVLSSLAILDLFADDFYAGVSTWQAQEMPGDLPPILSEEKADGRFWLIVWGSATRGCSGSHCAECYREKGGL